MLDKMGYTNITGIDFSQEQLNFAKDNCSNATIIHSDIKEYLSKNKIKYSLISAIDILEHFKKDELFEILNLVSETLSTNGIIIIQTPNAESPWGMSLRYGDFTHETAFSPSGLKSLLEHFGFTKFQPRECGPAPYGFKSYIRLIFWNIIKSFLFFCYHYISLTWLIVYRLLS